ncbi:MAG: Gfo/Idh/MocA family oxidoreductase [Planctomycetes bacterium]|nr:Gfo/Idh/MocA family oxidoreductase [Planctomycetota bacterium]
MANRPLNVGLVGGGKGAFIVHPHQRAIHFDGTRRVTAGALHADPAIAMQEAANWTFPLQGHPSYAEMIDAQSKLPAEQRLDYVLIVTPNHVHFDPAMRAIAAGIPVFCEKPLCLDLREANALVKAVRKAGLPFGLAHTYLGHWTTRLARYIVRNGLIGDVRWVDSYYVQGWLATKLEATGQQQATWRTDPKLAGGSGCGGDIGTHALMQLRYVTGLEVEAVSAQLETFVEGRPLDDHFTAYCRLGNGGKALVRASQVCIGHKNDLGIEVAGTKGTLRWRQEEPEQLVVHLPGQPDRVYWRAAISAGDGFLPKDKAIAALLAEPTVPSGHPEAFHDAFARLHRFFEADVRAWQAKKPLQYAGSGYATIDDGWTGMAFLAACLKSSAKKGAWTVMPAGVARGA